MRFIIVTSTLCIIILAVMVACGGAGDGDADRTLVLNSGSFTEQEYRVRLRARFINADLWEPICDEARRSTFDEFVNLLGELDDSLPEQQAVRSDQERAFEIIREECKRRF